MITAKYDLYLEQNVNFQFDFQVLDDAGKPLDFTGFKGVCQIRKTASSTETLAIPKVEIFSDAKVKVTLAADETKRIPATGSDFNDFNKYMYELHIIDVLGNVALKIYGYIFVSAGVIK